MAYSVSRKFRAAAGWIGKRADGSDLQALIGLGLLSYGISLISVPWAFIAAGAIFLLSGFGRELAGFVAIARGSEKRK